MNKALVINVTFEQQSYIHKTTVGCDAVTS